MLGQESRLLDRQIGFTTTSTGIRTILLNCFPNTRKTWRTRPLRRLELVRPPCKMQEHGVFWITGCWGRFPTARAVSYWEAVSDGSRLGVTIRKTATVFADNPAWQDFHCFWPKHRVKKPKCFPNPAVRQWNWPRNPLSRGIFDFKLPGLGVSCLDTKHHSQLEQIITTGGKGAHKIEVQ